MKPRSGLAQTAFCWALSLPGQLVPAPQTREAGGAGREAEAVLLTDQNHFTSVRGIAVGSTLGPESAVRWDRRQELGDGEIGQSIPK